MAASSSSDAGEAALYALAHDPSVPIISNAKVLPKPKDQRSGIIAYRVAAEQRQTSKTRDLLACVPSLRELILEKHATCIAEKNAEIEAAAAAAAHTESQGVFGVMTDSALRERDVERHAKELAEAKKMVEQTRAVAAEAEARAEAARRAEVEAAAHLVAPRNEAEAMAASLAAIAARAEEALAELQPDEKRARTDDDDGEPSSKPADCQRRRRRRRLLGLAGPPRTSPFGGVGQRRARRRVTTPEKTRWSSYYTVGAFGPSVRTKCLRARCITPASQESARPSDATAPGRVARRQ